MRIGGAIARAEPAPIEMDEAFAALRDAFEGAAAACGDVERWLTVAGLPIRLRFAGPALVAKIMPAFAHLPSVSAPDRADVLTICLWDTASTGTRLPPSPLLPRLEDPPVRPVYRTENLSFVFNAYRYRSQLSFLDAGQAVALYCTDDAARFPAWAMACPLSTILNWWLSRQGMQLVHAAAVGNDGTGVLLVGPSGSGKSTASLACLSAGLDYAGDDHVVLAPEPPYAHSLYSSGKLSWSHRSSHPELLPDPVNAPARDNDDEGEKAIAFLAPSLGSRISRGFAVRAVLLPRVTDQAHTTLVPTTAATALLALAPSTVLQVPGDGAGAFDRMGRLLRQVPSFRLDLGRDLTTVPQVVGALLAQLGTDVQP